MRPKPKDALHPKIFKSPAAAAAAASVTAAYAFANSEKLDLSEKEDSNFKVGSQQDLSAEASAVREEKKKLESALQEAISDSSALKAKIEETNGTYAELSKVSSHYYCVCLYWTTKFEHLTVCCRNSIQFKGNL